MSKKIDIQVNTKYNNNNNRYKYIYIKYLENTIIKTSNIIYIIYIIKDK